MTEERRATPFRPAQHRKGREPGRPGGRGGPLQRLERAIRLLSGAVRRDGPVPVSRPARTDDPWRLIGPLAAALLLAAAAGTALAAAGTRTIVSQRGRAFLPGTLTVKRGDTVEIVNDDGDLMHHAYIDDPAFSFDSGDQEPGAKADIEFTKAGRFTVLCGIHPKMKLVVTVQE